jgi:HTH-type transcriptional regulator/antitoxin HigA
VITNERQYKITKGQLAKLYEEIEEFVLDEVAKRIGSEILAKAELDGLKSEIDVLEAQLQEYESLKSGAITNFQAKSLGELPIILIRARIAQQLSQRELGNLVGLKEQQIQRYESDKYASASLRRLREIATALELSVTEIAEITPLSKSSSKSQKPITLDWSKFPAREMYNRGWFEEFHGSITDLTLEANELVENFVTATIRKPTLALHRKHLRLGGQFDPYALLAWECRILALASNVESFQQYYPELVTVEWRENLKRLSSFDDGPARVKAMLKEVGIVLVIEPHLPGTYLDGAAMLLNGEIPVIGLTLRYDRLDNFWFVLFHELIHVTKHLQKNKLENIFDDLDIEVEEEIEKEADALARDALIPSSEWEKALPRYTQSTESIIRFASKLRIEPSIVAGRIRSESKNYAILSNLVGQGKVRKHFPEVKFGV